jgi:hypothetical protein
MKQANLGLDLTTKRTRKREFLDEMDRVVPWGKLVALMTPQGPEGKRGLCCDKVGEAKTSVMKRSPYATNR